MNSTKQLRKKIYQFFKCLKKKIEAELVLPNSFYEVIIIISVLKQNKVFTGKENYNDAYEYKYKNPHY